MTTPQQDQPAPPRRIAPHEEPRTTAIDPLRFPWSNAKVNAFVREALDEDMAFDDVTTIATVVSDRRARARLVARRDGVIAGVPFALAAFNILDSKSSFRIDAEDGTRVTKGETIVFISGHARGILSAERVALNFMQRMSGIATLTARYVEAVRGTSAKILDTRKTTPGWRALEKYAVRAGRGFNHRMDLATAVLIKDNHLVAVEKDIGLAVRRARELVGPEAIVEVECESQDQVRGAVAAEADIILLDNMPLEMMRECVGIVAKRAIVEASGGVSLETVRAIAETGVDHVSVGALTHSAPALDLALDFE